MRAVETVISAWITELDRGRMRRPRDAGGDGAGADTPGSERVGMDHMRTVPGRCDSAPQSPTTPTQSWI
jgi:hypothetical protein